MPIQESHSWEWVAAAKRKATLAKIPEEWILPEYVIKDAAARRKITGSFIEALLSDRECAITNIASPVLIERIRERWCTAAEVTLAYCKRAAFAHQLNNCLHEIFFSDAINAAEKLDAHLANTGETVGPLHGLPVSLKDQFHVKDVETTMGYVSWVGTFEGEKGTGKEFSEESQLVEELKSLGAVLYCKTSCPQTLLLGETVNNLIGSTMNPVNQLLSCGGSSGGEGALLALGGSSIGVGTDIGGSVRIPASFCGVYSIKPSFGRFSYRKVANNNPGQTIVNSAIGFMSTSLSALDLCMESILSTKPWLRDPDVVEIPWRPHLKHQPKKLCFAVIRNDGMCTPHPPIARGVEIAVEAAKRAGHKKACLGADGGHDVWKQLSILHEPLIPPLEEMYGDGPTDPMLIPEYQDYALKRLRYTARYMEYWNSTVEFTGTGRPVDAVIMPVAPHAAVIPNRYFHYGYTEIADLLNFTAVAIPITTVDKSVDKIPNNFEPLNDEDLKNWEAYDADVYDGAPVGIQLLGRRFDEEHMISIAEEFVKLL
ncbi:hypothetical protein Hte_007796 [Hypoxylon texense]